MHMMIGWIRVLGFVAGLVSSPFPLSKSNSRHHQGQWSLPHLLSPDTPHSLNELHPRSSLVTMHGQLFQMQLTLSRCFPNREEEPKRKKENSSNTSFPQVYKNTQSLSEVLSAGVQALFSAGWHVGALVPGDFLLYYSTHTPTHSHYSHSYACQQWHAHSLLLRGDQRPPLPSS